MGRLLGKEEVIELWSSSSLEAKNTLHNYCTIGITGNYYDLSLA